MHWQWQKPYSILCLIVMVIYSSPSASFIYTGNNYSVSTAYTVGWKLEIWACIRHGPWLWGTCSLLFPPWALQPRILRAKQQSGMQNILWLLEAMKDGSWLDECKATWSSYSTGKWCMPEPCPDPLLSNPTLRWWSAIFSQSWKKLRGPILLMFCSINERGGLHHVGRILCPTILSILFLQKMFDR